MLKRLFGLVLCGLLVVLMVSVTFAAPSAKQQVSTVCEMSSDVLAPMQFTRGMEECSLSQAKQFYIPFSDALQNLEQWDEFSIELPYEVGVCADERWITARTKAGTIYCYLVCECTEYGDICYAECIYIP